MDRYYETCYYRIVPEDGAQEPYCSLDRDEEWNFSSSLEKGAVVFKGSPYRLTCRASESEHYTYEDTLDLDVFYDLKKITWKEYNRLSKKADKQKKAAARAYRRKELFNKVDATLDRIRRPLERIGWPKTLSLTKTFWIICGLWVVFEAIAITVCVVFGLPSGVGLGEKILTSVGAATALTTIIYVILKGLDIFS